MDACDSLGNAIIFLDEVDAVAQSRDIGGGGGAMHEASRRVLSTILQRIEGESNNNNDEKLEYSTRFGGCLYSH
jgi:ATP-dependent Zn protease